MKTLMIAAVTATALSASVANANDLALLGGLEYAVQAESFEATAGLEYGIAGLTLTPVITLNDASGDFKFAAAEFTVGYSFSTTVNVYATVEADSNWKYTETTLGVALRF
jgi:hypothetical protein